MYVCRCDVGAERKPLVTCEGQATPLLPLSHQQWHELPQCNLSLSLSPQHPSSSPSTRTHLLITTKMYIKTERIIYQKAPIPPPICSRRLYRSALATTSLYLFLLCADFPFYRLLHIWCRGSKPLTRCVEECQRPVFHTQGSSCGLIYPFALCAIQ